MDTTGWDESEKSIHVKWAVTPPLLPQSSQDSTWIRQIKP